MFQSPPAVAAASVGFGAAAYGQDASAAGGFGGASSYESSSFSSSGFGGDAAGAGLAVGGGYGGASGFESSSSSFESSSYSSGGAAGGVDVAGAAFHNVDSNNDGSIDRAEFNRFFQQGL